MTTFALTPDANDFTGGNGPDTFAGFGGGEDSLLGKKGADSFEIQYAQTGLIDGGKGTDRIFLDGHNNNTFDLGLTIKHVENFVTTNSLVYATATQLNGFTHFEFQTDSDGASLFLQGQGGTLDLSESYTAPQALEIDATMAESGETITGSMKADLFTGSDFDDVLNGAGGKDTMYGGEGNDTLDGGAKRDTLYGEGGNDIYMFSTKPKGDHIGDFRPEEDRIAFDHDFFSGLHTGDLSFKAFKDIGTGTEDKSDRILFDSTTGEVFYDADGSKHAHDAKLVAVLDNFAGDIPTLTHSEVFVV